MPSKDQDGCNENSTKRFGKYLHDTAMTAGVAAKSFASVAKAVAAAGRSMNNPAASFARREEEEARDAIRDAVGRSVSSTNSSSSTSPSIHTSSVSSTSSFGRDRTREVTGITDESVPSSPHQRPSQEGSLHLQALADHGVRGAAAGRRWREPLHIDMREVANIGMSTDEVANAVSILADLADPTPRPTIRMIRFRKE